MCTLVLTDLKTETLVMFNMFDHCICLESYLAIWWISILTQVKDIDLFAPYVRFAPSQIAYKVG